MRRVLLGQIALVCICGWSAVEACGDKFMLLGRGTIFQRAYAAMYPGSIVLFLPGNAGGGERAENLHKMLTRAGHRVRIIADAAILADPLHVQQTDIVIVDISGASTLKGMLGTSGGGPTVFYYSNERDKSRGATIPGASVLKASDKAPTVLRAIDGAMKVRAQAGTRVKRG